MINRPPPKFYGTRDIIKQGALRTRLVTPRRGRPT